MKKNDNEDKEQDKTHVAVLLTLFQFNASMICQIKRVGGKKAKTGRFNIDPRVQFNTRGNGKTRKYITRLLERFDVENIYLKDRKRVMITRYFSLEKITDVLIAFAESEPGFLIPGFKKRLEAFRNALELYRKRGYREREGLLELLKLRETFAPGSKSQEQFVKEYGL